MKWLPFHHLVLPFPPLFLEVALWCTRLDNLRGVIAVMSEAGLRTPKGSSE